MPSVIDISSDSDNNLPAKSIKKTDSLSLFTSSPPHAVTAVQHVSSSPEQLAQAKTGIQDPEPSSSSQIIHLGKAKRSFSRLTNDDVPPPPSSSQRQITEPVSSPVMPRRAQTAPQKAFGWLSDSSEGSQASPQRKKSKRRPEGSRSASATAVMSTSNAKTSLTGDLGKAGTSPKMTREEKQNLRRLDSETKKVEQAANKLKTKHDMSREMFMDVSTDLSKQRDFASSWTSLLAKIEGQDRCPIATFDGPLPNIVRWRRRMTASYDHETKVWSTLDVPYIATEPTVLLFHTADEICEMIKAESLQSHINNVRSTMKLSTKDQVLVMIMGVQAYQRKRDNASNREMQRAVTGDTTTNLRYVESDFVARQVLDKELIRLTLKYCCFVIKIEKADEILRWLQSLTADIGLRLHKIDHLSFCPDGPGRCGKDPPSTYLKMLQSIPRVTASASLGICALYPSIKSLYEGWAQCKTDRERFEMLADAEDMVTRSGKSKKNNMIGISLSTKIWTVFNEVDELR